MNAKIILADALNNVEHPVIILAANWVKYLMEMNDEDVPGWILVLAGGNPNNIEAVLDEARRFKTVDDEENEKGVNYD